MTEEDYSVGRLLGGGKFRSAKIDAHVGDGVLGGGGGLCAGAGGEWRGRACCEGVAADGVRGGEMGGGGSGAATAGRAGGCGGTGVNDPAPAVQTGLVEVRGKMRRCQIS